jgi:hypothetical protein
MLFAFLKLRSRNLIDIIKFGSHLYSVCFLNFFSELPTCFLSQIRKPINISPKQLGESMI